MSVISTIILLKAVTTATTLEPRSLVRLAHALTPAPSPTVTAKSVIRLTWKLQTRVLISLFTLSPKILFSHVCLAAPYPLSHLTNKSFSLVASKHQLKHSYSPLSLTLKLSIFGRCLLVWVRLGLRKPKLEWSLENSLKDLRAWRSTVKNWASCLVSKIDWGWSWNTETTPKPCA